MIFVFEIVLQDVKDRFKVVQVKNWFKKISEKGMEYQDEREKYYYKYNEQNCYDVIDGVFFFKEFCIFIKVKYCFFIKNCRMENFQIFGCNVCVINDCNGIYGLERSFYVFVKIIVWELYYKF